MTTAKNDVFIGPPHPSVWKTLYIISDNQTDAVRQRNVKNELTILRTIIIVKFNYKVI